MDQSSFRRSKLFIDPKVQGALVLRAASYWLFCLLSITLLLLCWRIFTGPARLFYTHFDEMWFHFGPAMVASLLILPLVLVDVVRLSNRFAGPLVRLRRGMRALSRGETVEPIHFRDGDYWQDFAEDFNAVATIIQRNSGKPASQEFADDDAEGELVVVGAIGKAE